MWWEQNQQREAREGEEKKKTHKIDMNACMEEEKGRGSGRKAVAGIEW